MPDSVPIPLASAIRALRAELQEAELVNRCSWPTRADLRVAVFEWIEVFYNRQRI